MDHVEEINVTLHVYMRHTRLVHARMQFFWEKIYSHNLKYGYYVIYNHVIIKNCKHAIFVIVDNSIKW